MTPLKELAVRPNAKMQSMSIGRLVAHGISAKGTAATHAPATTMGQRPVRRGASRSEIRPIQGWMMTPSPVSRPMIRPMTVAEDTKWRSWAGTWAS
ncbi:hypothetical protein [Streptomyces mirabilis]|uniref:hypothetical protein n=1 Tax=Streptomyces mirabilis TaxID=68239 RepID=UPI0033297E1A